MTATADSFFRATLRQVREDLKTFPGRLSIAWRVGALCALMAMVAMIYGIPASAISCYLILFVMKPDSLLSIMMAIAVIILVSLLVGAILLILPYVLASPPLRMLVLVGSSILFVWLGSASKLGDVGNIIALVIAFLMTLIGEAPNGELATRALLYAWLMVATPMLLLVLVMMFIGRSSWKMLCQSLAARLQLAADALRQPDTAALKLVRDGLRKGQTEYRLQMMLIKIFHLRSSAQTAWLESAIAQSYRLLLATAALAPGMPPSERESLAAACQAACEALQRGEASAQPVPPGESEIHQALRGLAIADTAGAPKAEKSDFLAPDAFSNPKHIRFALKTTLASVICYFVYTILQWQDIHTAMITCYVAVLGTTGETVHKLTLRIVGCLLGATIGIISLLWLLPMMTDVGQLMLLVFPALTLAAWVSSGNERIAYAGIQIGLAFLLTVLHGYSPSTDVDVAFYRIAGILLGNLAVWVIFTQIWPVSITNAVHIRLGEAVGTLDKMAASPTASPLEKTERASQVEESLASAADLMQLMPFEPQRIRASEEERTRLHAILQESTTLCPPVFLGDSVVPVSPEAEPRDNKSVQQRITRLKELLG